MSGVNITGRDAFGQLRGLPPGMPGLIRFPPEPDPAASRRRNPAGRETDA